MFRMPPESAYEFPGPENLHSDIYPAIDPTNENADLKQPGKVVLITGAGRGIGRAVAIQYAHAGVSSIVLCARTSSQLDEVEAEIKKISEDLKVLKIPLDVTSEDAVQKCAKTVERETGRLDVLVNNAGYTTPWVLLADSKADDWWKTFEVNMKGPFLFLHAFLPLLVKTAKSEMTVVDVVNMTTIGGHMVLPTSSAYSISKCALDRLTEFVVAEYGASGVNAVTLHPGGVVTDLSRNLEILNGRKLFHFLFT